MIAAACRRLRQQAAQNPAYMARPLFFNDLRTFCTVSANSFHRARRVRSRDFQIIRNSSCELFGNAGCSQLQVHADKYRAHVTRTPRNPSRIDAKRGITSYKPTSQD